MEAIAQHRADGARPPTVLVVEDEALVRAVVADHLRLSGFRVIEAGDAEEGYRLLSSGEIAVDLLFSDVHLPGPMDGVGLARCVRERWPETRVMLTSGVAQIPTHLQGILLDAPLLSKPYDLDDVERLIRSLVIR